MPTYLQGRNKALIALLYNTGLRRSEVAAFDAGNIDLDAGTVYLPGSYQKGGWADDATLEPGLWGANSMRSLKRYLQNRWKETEALFPARLSDRMSPTAIYNRVRRLAEIADIRPRMVGSGRGGPADVSPHTLRHSVAYRVLQVEKGRLEDVQARLRHTNLATTDRVYSHIMPR